MEYYRNWISLLLGIFLTIIYDVFDFNKLFLLLKEEKKIEKHKKVINEYLQTFLLIP